MLMYILAILEYYYVRIRNQKHFGRKNYGVSFLQNSFARSPRARTTQPAACRIYIPVILLSSSVYSDTFTSLEDQRFG